MPDDFMIKTLTEYVDHTERRRDFINSAIESAKEVDETGIAYAANDVFAYIRAKAAGLSPQRPKPIKL